MIDRKSPCSPVAIIGGGATGAALAYHFLHRRTAVSGPVLIFEPRARIGAGLAYGSHDPQHRINVPAAKMSIDTGRPLDFQEWIDRDRLLAQDPDALAPSGGLFPARRVFGRYLADRIEPWLRSEAALHVRARVVSIQKDGDLWRIGTDDGIFFQAARVVIATTHPVPSLPTPLRPLSHDPRIVIDPWSHTWLDSVAPDARIAIIGSGLTMADVVASLTARGHRGLIIAISRRGLRSQSHAKAEVEAHGDFSITPARSARALLRNVRCVLADDPARPWQATFDALRRQGRAIWSALPPVERKRLVRHLRPFWDVHRFRIAPQVEATLSQRIASGTLRIRAARVESASATASAISLNLRARGGAVRHVDCDLVINTTGPDHAGILAQQPFLAGLARDGLIERDPLGLGLHTDEHHRAIVADHPVPGLFIAGPLSRGTFGELMGLPEVTANAQSVAATLAADVGASKIRERETL